MCDSEVMYHSILCKSRNDFPLFSCGSSERTRAPVNAVGAAEEAAAKNRKQELIDYMRTFKKHQIFSSAYAIPHGEGV